MPSRFFFIVIFAQIASVPELPEKKTKQKNPKLFARCFVSTLWEELVVWLGKYAALSLNTWKPNWHAFQRHYANSVLQASSLSTVTHTHISLPQSHFAVIFFVCCLGLFPRFFWPCQGLQLLSTDNCYLQCWFSTWTMETGLVFLWEITARFIASCMCFSSHLSHAEGTLSRRQKAEPPDVS